VLGGELLAGALPPFFAPIIMIPKGITNPTVLEKYGIAANYAGLRGYMEQVSG